MHFSIATVAAAISFRQKIPMFPLPVLLFLSTIFRGFFFFLGDFALALLGMMHVTNVFCHVINVWHCKH